MDIFEKLSDAVFEKGKEVSEKAKEFSEVINLKRRISTCEDVIRKNYIEIGRRYYKTQGEEPGEGYEEFCTAISDAKAEIEDLEEQIKQVKGI